MEFALGDAGDRDCECDPGRMAAASDPAAGVRCPVSPAPGGKVSTRPVVG